MIYKLFLKMLGLFTLFLSVFTIFSTAPADAASCDNLLSDSYYIGQQSSDVKDLQDCLTFSGDFNYSGGSTGYYGPITQSALNSYKTRVVSASPTPTSTETTACSALLSSLYFIGQQGSNIVQLQDCLTTTGHFTYSGGSTGYYGNITQTALNAYKSSQDSTTTTPTPDITITTITQSKCDVLTSWSYYIGQQSDDVKDLQDCLATTGHFTFHGGSTGYYGSITDTALRAFLSSTTRVVVSGESEFVGFTDQDFVNYYDSVSSPSSTSSDSLPAITGSARTDEYIRQVAESRGYRVRSIETKNLVWVDGYQLNNSAANAWESLKRSASKDGIDLKLTSGYRGVDEQRQIFNSRFGVWGEAEILSGSVDWYLNNALDTVAPPGYSKHHSGDTVDIGQVGYYYFEGSPGYSWMVSNRYFNSIESGFIPSYPKDGFNMGPVSEAWEYVYVGADI